MMDATQELRQDADQGDAQDDQETVNKSSLWKIPDRYQEDTLSRAQACLLIVWAAILAAACVLGALMH
jgi:hypothetical protein